MRQREGRASWPQFAAQWVFKVFWSPTRRTSGYVGVHTEKESQAMEPDLRKASGLFFETTDSDYDPLFDLEADDEGLD